MITLFTSGGTLGIALSQIIFYHSFYYFQGHTVFLAIPLMMLVVCLTLSNVKPIEQPRSAQGSFSLGTFKTFFRRKDLSLLYISQVCNQSLCWGAIFLLPDVLISREYESWLCFGGGHLCFVMGSFLMQPIAGLLADKYSCRTVILAATALGMAGFYLFIFSPLMPTSWLMILLFFLGTAMGLVNPVSGPGALALVPENPGMIKAHFLWAWSGVSLEGIGQGGGGSIRQNCLEDMSLQKLLDYRRLVSLLASSQPYCVCLAKTQFLRLLKINPKPSSKI